MGSSQYRILVTMPSQEVGISYGYKEEGGILKIMAAYLHPTREEPRVVRREPQKASFSQKHFQKELDAYVVQEVMSDLMDNRHSYDWIE